MILKFLDPELNSVIFDGVKFVLVDTGTHRLFDLSRTNIFLIITCTDLRSLIPNENLSLIIKSPMGGLKGCYIYSHFEDIVSVYVTGNKDIHKNVLHFYYLDEKCKKDWDWVSRCHRLFKFGFPKDFVKNLLQNGIIPEHKVIYDYKLGCGKRPEIIGDKFRENGVCYATNSSIYKEMLRLKKEHEL